MVEQSANLLPGSWHPVPTASLESMGERSRFTIARPAAGGKLLSRCHGAATTTATTTTTADLF